MFAHSLPRLSEEAQYGLVAPGQEFYLPNLPDRYLKVSPKVARIVRDGRCYDFTFHPAERVWRVIES